MNTEGERLKLLRQALGIRQGDFASKISTTQGHISDIENGRKNLSERTIKLISLENWDGKLVNEEWLRNGVGEMFLPNTREDDIARLTADLFKEEENSFKARLILTLSKLDENEWALLEKIAKEFTKDSNKKN